MGKEVAFKQEHMIDVVFLAKAYLRLAEQVDNPDYFEEDLAHQVSLAVVARWGK